MARDVSPLRPARPRLRVQDLERLALMNYARDLERLLLAAISWDDALCQDDPEAETPDWKEEARDRLGL